MDNQTPNQEQTNPNPYEQLKELVRNLTPDTSNKIKARLLPPAVGLVVPVGPFFFKVSYINPGKMSFTAEFYGINTVGGILRPGGAVDPIGKPPAPAAQEGLLPKKNVTLDVHSSSVDANSIFYRDKTANGQQPAK